MNDGSVKRKNGAEFVRGGPAKNIDDRYKWGSNMKEVVKKIDKKIRGEARGGMIYFDPIKQIIPPFAPPPLKPPLPNSKTFKWG